MHNLFIISNESVFEKSNEFYCDNIDAKSTPEGLSKFFKINLFVRNSKKERAHKINLKNIKIGSNFFSFAMNILKKNRHKDTKYLIISITPYTFLISLLLRFLGKKPLVYLRSDGYKEYKVILGFLGPILYHFMFSIISNITTLVSCKKNILRGKPGQTILPSQLSKNWFEDLKEPILDKAKLLYVGRIKKEKGIFSLLELIKNIDLDLTLTIVGAEKNFISEDLIENVNIFSIEKNENRLKKFYDDNNIFILPSFTEGYPMVLLESLARLRPVIVFKDIIHVSIDMKGVFVCERNNIDLRNTINFILRNYIDIQHEIKKNILPTNDEFIGDLVKIINNN